MRFLPLLLATAAQAFVLQCNEVNPQNARDPFNLSELSGGKATSKETETPPTKNEAKLRLNLCEDVGKESDVDDSDQCPDDSRACFQIINHKGDDRRITSVINMWPHDVAERDVDVMTTEEGLKIDVRGGEYAGVPQRLSLRLFCSEEEAGPDIQSYERGILSVTWKHPAVCPKTVVSSGGWFSSLFWFLFILLGLYFVVGAVYNHQQYSARGLDLIPNRTFWQELPILFRDFTSHIFSSGRDSGRGGYSSLG